VSGKDWFEELLRGVKYLYSSRARKPDVVADSRTLSSPVTISSGKDDIGISSFWKGGLDVPLN
jgi:hypothetical protein